MVIVSYREQDHEQLIQIWERAVRATHTFLAEHDIQFYRNMVGEILEQRQVEVWEALDMEQQPVGFIGLQNNVIEMLFVDPSQHGQGVGRLLIEHTIELKGHYLKVDVNEQNAGATQFYKKMGFVQIGRSELDGSGNPFPLLHLEIS
ncbi:acetyltransferase [Paenibacillus xylanexedens]|uniref:acetyltransferase n=1 Tax=Paenibacillus xylanexedens TaxID=528191 RepID=UPI0011AB1806|nr:acetyltransferase [Paenibacillus xylanexedens]